MCFLPYRQKPKTGTATIGGTILASLLLIPLIPSARCEDAVTPISAAMAVAENIERPYQRFNEMAELATTGYPESEKQRGIEMLDQLRVRAANVARGSDGGLPIEAVAVGYIEIGEIDAAVEIHQQLGMTEDRIRSLFHSAHRLRYRKQFKESDRLLSHMTAAISDVEIDDPSRRDQFLTHVSTYYAKNDHIDTALQIARSITDAARRESALVEVAIEAMPFQSPEQAIEIIASAADPQKKNNGVRALIKYLCENARPDEAVNCLKLLEEDPRGQDGERASVAAAYAEAGRIAESEKMIAGIGEGHSLSLATKALAPALARQGRIAEARGYANAIKNSYDRCKVLAAMGGACLAVGNDDEAMALFNEAKDIVRTFDDPFQNIPLLESIARAAAENGKLDYSLEIAESMKGKGIQLIDKWEVLSILAWKFQDSGNTQKAIKVAGMISDRYTRISSFASIAANLAYKGKDAEAFEVANLLPQGTDRDEAMHCIANEFAARKSFQQALEVVEKISDPPKKTEALSFIAKTYAKHMESPTLAEAEILRRIIGDAKRSSR